MWPKVSMRHLLNISLYISESKTNTHTHTKLQIGFKERTITLEQVKLILNRTNTPKATTSNTSAEFTQV